MIYMATRLAAQLRCMHWRPGSSAAGMLEQSSLSDFLCPFSMTFYLQHVSYWLYTVITMVRTLASKLLEEMACMQTHTI